MTRLLILGLLLLIAIGVLVSRLKPYLRGAREVFRAFQGSAPSRPSASGSAKTERLVACAACGTRVPASRALSAGGAAVFCSPACRDRDADDARHLAG
ncbi:MAG: PP0621 family protein [Thermoanaerobaculia bacterium]